MMPALSVWLLRFSFTALLAGAVAGGWLLGMEPWASVWAPRLRASHLYLMLFGWLLPFVLGVAYWILPRHGSGEPRGSLRAATAGGVLLAGGATAGTIGPLLQSSSFSTAGTLATAAGAALLLATLWPRVKQFG